MEKRWDFFVVDERAAVVPLLLNAAPYAPYAPDQLPMAQSVLLDQRRELLINNGTSPLDQSNPTLLFCGSPSRQSLLGRKETHAPSAHHVLPFRLSSAAAPATALVRLES